MAMTATKVEAWNRALYRIGQTTKILDEAEDTEAAYACSLIWDDCVGEALELRNWPWAKGQATLAVVTGVIRIGWEYVYGLPADFVAACAILSGEVRFSLVPGEGRVAYEIQANDAGNGQVLCTDLEVETTDILEYTRRIDSIVAMPRLFLNAVVWRLAAELALSLVKGTEGARLSNGCLAAFDDALRVAHARQLVGQQLDQELDAPSIRARE
jgi:hypothetical protein